MNFNDLQRKTYFGISLKSTTAHVPSQILYWDTDESVLDSYKTSLEVCHNESKHQNLSQGNGHFLWQKAEKGEKSKNLDAKFETR